MPYVTGDGSLQQSKPYGLNTLFNIFWGSIEFVNLFFRSLFHLDGGSDRGQYGSGQSAPRTPGGRRMGGVGRVSGIAAPPCGAGG